MHRTRLHGRGSGMRHGDFVRLMRTGRRGMSDAAAKFVSDPVCHRALMAVCRGAWMAHTLLLFSLPEINSTSRPFGDTFSGLGTEDRSGQCLPSQRKVISRVATVIILISFHGYAS